MITQVRVRLIAGGPWRRGRLWLRGNCPVLRLEDKRLGPTDVDGVVVSSACPIELLDAAVAAGFYVVGRRRKVAR